MPRVVTVTLESISPYSQSKHYDVPKKPKELARDYEERTWRERTHVMPNGNIFIPPMCFKLSVEVAAKFLSMQIPGKGKATYTKHIQSGILVAEGIELPIKKDEVLGEYLFVPSDGRKGGGKRVMKCFPLIREWRGKVTYYLIDDIITQDVFEKHVIEAGNFIGIGRFRCERGGYYGRYKATKFEWGAEPE